MKVYDTEQFICGWFIGDFTPSVIRTTAYEAGYKLHAAGEKWPVHYHEHMDEINFLLEGEMVIQGKTLIGPCVFLLERNEIADPIFVTDCKIFIIKTPSVPGDKVIIGEKHEH
jgi:hypothetical protein